MSYLSGRSQAHPERLEIEEKGSTEAGIGEGALVAIISGLGGAACSLVHHGEIFYFFLKAMLKLLLSVGR